MSHAYTFTKAMHSRNLEPINCQLNPDHEQIPLTSNQQKIMLLIKKNDSYYSDTKKNPDLYRKREDQCKKNSLT